FLAGHDVNPSLPGTVCRIDGDHRQAVYPDVVFRGLDFRVELENGMYFYLASAPEVGQNIKIKILKIEVI
ncbi:MAG: hypothetical protein WCP19_14860, partial [Chloroflexota bacterium]